MKTADHQSSQLVASATTTITVAPDNRPAVTMQTVNVPRANTTAPVIVTHQRIRLAEVFWIKENDYEYQYFRNDNG